MHSEQFGLVVNGSDGFANTLPKKNQYYDAWFQNFMFAFNFAFFLEHNNAMMLHLIVLQGLT